MTRVMLALAFVLGACDGAPVTCRPETAREYARMSCASVCEGDAGELDRVCVLCVAHGTERCSRVDAGAGDSAL